MRFASALKERVFVLDGAMGTEILRRTGQGFEFPEILNIERKNIILDIHRTFIDAGADIITTNTFGANRLKLEEFQAGNRVKELNSSAVEIAKRAREERDVFVAGSMGPIGRLIHPLGDLKEEDVYNAYAEQAGALEKSGVDFLLIETQIDLLEAKIAARAAMERTSLPVAVSLSFSHEEGRTVTGTDPEVFSISFSSTGLEILGINCGGHPGEFEKFIEKIRLHCDKPLAVYANAGIPEKKGGKVIYPLSPEEYAKYAWKFYELGASVIGGCCGTTPEHIRLISKMLKGKRPVKRKERECFFRASSRNSTLILGGSLPLRVIGENINPFGRKKLDDELHEGKFELLRSLVRKQEQAGADALDVNLGKKGEKEPEFFASAVKEIQSITKLPLFLDNSSPSSLEIALRSYAGKAVINSVNGRKESFETLLPLARKYGAAVILLAMDQNGIPEKAEGRFQVIEDLLQKAIHYGLSMDDILADPIVLTIATSPKAAMETLRAIEMIKTLGIPVTIGLSNLSYGLPQKKILNSSFLSMAMDRGLNSAILNPLDENLMSVIKACDAITGRNKGIQSYTEKFGKRPEIEVEEKPEAKPKSLEQELFQAVVEGEKNRTEALTESLVKKGMNGFVILEKILSPALKQVGEYYEEKIYFLPQLILSAEAMERASEILKGSFQMEKETEDNIRIVLATVRGDMHDLGKNIVSLVLRSYGYVVNDLGKNIESEKIVETALKSKANFIGLSALMTTTMEEMKKVIDIRDLIAPGIKVIVGGAAVTPSFAREIGADAYGKDAMDAIRKIEKISGKRK